MDAIARGAGRDPEEIRLANFFPELFHCSGFAVSGLATKDGRLYHGRVLDRCISKLSVKIGPAPTAPPERGLAVRSGSNRCRALEPSSRVACAGRCGLKTRGPHQQLRDARVLDYLRGVGLEQNAVVIINRPDLGHAWVNISYAGFVGSVTAMNDQKVAIGEMGGRGEGHWDGKPMAQLVHEVMEKAGTLEEAVEIMRKGPRTCEYYYVISDGKTRRSVGIAATPDTFETVWPGEKHERLPEAIQDAVLLSAGDRYQKLVERVRDKYGAIEDEGARELMKRPVCMESNIHSVLFAPDTLDFWVANADSTNPASHTRYTHFILADWLRPPATR